MQSLELLFNENSYWRTMWVEYFGMSTTEYRQFLISLQEMHISQTVHNISFIIKSVNWWEMPTIFYIMRQVWTFRNSALAQMILCNKSEIKYEVHVEENIISLVSIKSNALFWWTHDHGIVVLNTLKVPKLPQLLGLHTTDLVDQIIDEQFVLEEEATSISRLTLISTALQQEELQLPNVIVASVLQYLPNITIQYKPKVFYPPPM